MHIWATQREVIVKKLTVILMVCIAWSFLLVSSGFAKQEITPRQGNTAPKNQKWDERKPANIPTNLNECFSALENIMTSKELKAYKGMSESDAVLTYNASLGLWIRDNWGLWAGDSALETHLNGIGIDHPDDMSAYILRAFHRYLSGVSINPSELNKQYRAKKK